MEMGKVINGLKVVGKVAAESVGLFVRGAAYAGGMVAGMGLAWKALGLDKTPKATQTAQTVEEVKATMIKNQEKIDKVMKTKKEDIVKGTTPATVTTETTTVTEGN